VWELPGAKLEAGEPPLDTARRELAEEAGVAARDWHALEFVWSSPGVFAERLYLFMATGLEAVNATHERSEVIEIHWVPLAQACAWALDGTITDCKTIVGLLRARDFSARTPTGNNP
jgi:8-oxo-dGTP pyrophosphatase MutT (NUDIX family)